MKIPTYPEERILVGLVLGGATWAICRYGIQLPWDDAITYGVLMAILGGVLGGWIFRFALGAAVVADAADGKLSQTSRHILENRDDYFG